MHLIASQDQPASLSRSGRRLAWLGALVAWAAVVTYYTVVPRWPDLRDSGHLNVALTFAGVVLSVFGLRRARVAGSRARASVFALSLGLAAAGFLAFYIYVLSYQLPPSDGVIAVGSKAPDFRLQDQDGRERSLAEFTGRRLYLVFFRGHW